MTPNGAFVSIDEIINAWLFKNGKTVHSYAKVMAFAAEAVREMSYTSMNLVQHKILIRDCNDWWDLPSDYSDYVSAGIRIGEYWRPVGIRTGLMPFPYTDGIAQYNPSEFNEIPGQMNTTGQWINWLGPECDDASFWSGDFYFDDFNALQGGLEEMSLQTFAKMVKVMPSGVKRNKIVKESISRRVTVFTPRLSPKPNGPKYTHDCRYNMMRFKPGKDNVYELFGVETEEEATDTVIIASWKEFCDSYQEENDGQLPDLLAHEMFQVSKHRSELQKLGIISEENEEDVVDQEYDEF